MAGVALIGALGSLAIRGVGSNLPGDRVGVILDLLGLENASLQNQVAILGVSASILLVGRTVISMLLTRRTIIFMSTKSSEVSIKLADSLLRKSSLDLKEFNPQEIIYSLTAGVNALLIGVLATTITLSADIAILILLWAALIFVDPVMAFVSAAIFGIIIVGTYRYLHSKARTLGTVDADLVISNNQVITEILETHREIVVRNRQAYYHKKLSHLKEQLAHTTAQLTFLPSVSKYVIEITVVFGALLVSASQFLLNDAARAVASLSIFLAASTRIAPSAMRIQQGLVQIQGSIGASDKTLGLILQLDSSYESEFSYSDVVFSYEGFTGKISMENVTFSYPDASEPVVKELNLLINPGETLAIVGPSGAGKTTLVDLLMGVLTPTSGNVIISGVTPSSAIQKWPGVISYVPQDVVIVAGTFLDNVTLGYEKEKIDLISANEALTVSQLDAVVLKSPLGMEMQVGERGSKLSGGERQRLGIARAMYSRPQLLVLDEASSALDGQTEYDLGRAIQALKGKVTVVMIAHRLSAIRDFDKVVYMDEGRVLAAGTFEQVRRAVPDFDRQASVMGL